MRRFGPSIVSWVISCGCSLPCAIHRVTLAVGTVYRVRVTTFNVDGWESAPAENVFTATAKKWSYYA